MDIDNNFLTNEVLSSSHNKSLSLNTTNLPFEPDFTKKNFINYSNSNLSKKINDLSKTMGQTNINALNLYANQNFIKNSNINLTNELYNTNLKIHSSDMNLTENNGSYPTEDSVILNSNSVALTNVDNSKSQSSSNVTSFTTTANPIPIPINSSSFHINENRDVNNFSYINSMETPTTHSMTKINETINSSGNVNSLPMFYPTDIDFNNNSLNTNNNSIINNPYGNPSSSITNSATIKEKEEQKQQQTSLPPKPPSFMSTTIANPLLSHDQAEKISFSAPISSSFNDETTNSLLTSNSKLVNHKFTNDHYSVPEKIKHKFNENMPVKIKLEDSSTPLIANKSSLNMDMNIDINYNLNINNHSQLPSSNATSNIPQMSTEVNNSLDLNTILSNQISNLHIHSIMDTNQEASSSTSTSTNIQTTNESDLQISSSSYSDKNQNSSSSNTTITSSNPNIYYTNINNNNNIIHKPSNSLLFRKNLTKSLKKPPQQSFLNYSNKYPLSSSLKLVKKEPGTKINFVKKKITMKSALSSSLDTKLSNIDINKKYNNNILNPSSQYASNNECNKMVSPSFILTSPDHISKPLNNYELSNKIQQAPVSVTPNNSYSGNSIFVRSNNLTIPNGKIQRNYGYDTKPISTSLTTKTIQNQHIIHNSLNDDIYTGGTNSSSFPYKYNLPTAFHKGYFSLASQLDILNEKRKKRKESHNATERRRRDFINEKIYELSTIIPESFFEQYIAENKMHKGVILQKSVEYINHLLTSLKTQQEYTSQLEKEINEHSLKKRC